MMDSPRTSAHAPDWGTAVVLDPRDLMRLESENARLRGGQRRRTIAASVLFASCLLSTSAAYWERLSFTKLSGALTAEVGRCERPGGECRKDQGHTRVRVA